MTTVVRPGGRLCASADVVSIVARHVARQVPGVHDVGRPRIGGALQRLGSHPGVRSRVGDRDVAITLDLVVEQGHRLDRVAQSVRTGVASAVEEHLARRVVEVTVEIHGVHVPARPTRRLE